MQQQRSHTPNNLPSKSSIASATEIVVKEGASPISGQYFVNVPPSNNKKRREQHTHPSKQNTDCRMQKIQSLKNQIKKNQQALQGRAPNLPKPPTIMHQIPPTQQQAFRAQEGNKNPKQRLLEEFSKDKIQKLIKSMQHPQPNPTESLSDQVLNEDGHQLQNHNLKRTFHQQNPLGNKRQSALEKQNANVQGTQGGQEEASKRVYAQKKQSVSEAKQNKGKSNHFSFGYISPTFYNDQPSTNMLKKEVPELDDYSQEYDPLQLIYGINVSRQEDRKPVRGVSRELHQQSNQLANPKKDTDYNPSYDQLIAFNELNHDIDSCELPKGQDHALYQEFDKQIKENFAKTPYFLKSPRSRQSSKGNFENDYDLHKSLSQNDQFCRQKKVLKRPAKLSHSSDEISQVENSFFRNKSTILTPSAPFAKHIDQRNKSIPIDQHQQLRYSPKPQWQTPQNGLIKRTNNKIKPVKQDKVGKRTFKLLDGNVKTTKQRH